MARFGHRVGFGSVLAGPAFAGLLLACEHAGAQEVVAAPAITPAGALALPGAAPPGALAAAAVAPLDAQRSDAAAPAAETHQPEEFRRARRGSGAESLDNAMRWRLEREERLRKQMIDELNEKRLRRLFGDLELMPEHPISLGTDRFDTPSLAFLRAVCPPDLEHTPCERRGFDRWASREISREWRRRYRADLDQRLAADPHRWADETDSEQQDVSRRLDENWAVLWSAPFPSYWEDHPSARGSEPVEFGEDIEIVRLGRLTVGNDMDVRYDLESVLSAYFPEPDRDPGSARRHRGTTGNVYTGGCFKIDARARLATALNALGSGFVSRVGTNLDCTFFDPYDRRDFCALKLEFVFDAAHDDQTVALMFDLLDF